MTYPVAVRVVKCLEFDNIRMADDAHDLQLTILNGGQSRLVDHKEEGGQGGREVVG